jgi:hypothetical protein
MAILVTGCATTRAPGRLAALAAWICTVAAGAYLLARRHSETDRSTRIVMTSHGALGGAGLAAWITFLATSALPLAWQRRSRHHHHPARATSDDRIRLT